MANYLYNGVELPDISTVYTPEMQKVYPNAYLFNMYNYLYSLCVVSEHLTSVKGADYTMLSSMGASVKHAKVDLYNNKDGWQEWKYDEGTLYLRDDTRNIYCLWANHDIFKEDGTVRLAASDPVPVNPPQPIDPNSLLQGYLVGCRLRANR